jgi:hypothetical protein
LGIRNGDWFPDGEISPLLCRRIRSRRQENNDKDEVGRRSMAMLEKELDGFSSSTGLMARICAVLSLLDSY